MKREKQKSPICRQCMIIRYFIFAAGLGILSIPFAGERFSPLSNLTAWHFVFVIWGIGVIGFLLKLVLEMRPTSATETDE